MTVRNDAITVQDESTDVRGEAILDELLDVLHEDNGGQRTAALRRALEIDDERGSNTATGHERSSSRLSNEVRIMRLQSSVESLAAYTDALEEFLDENGPAETIQEELTSAQSEIDTLETELDALEATDDELKSQLSAHANRLHSHEKRFEGLEDGIEHQSNQLDTLEARLNGLENAVGERLAELEAMLERKTDILAAAVQGLDQSMDEHVQSIEDSIDTEIQSVKQSFVDAFYELQRDVNSSLHELTTDVETLERETADTRE